MSSANRVYKYEAISGIRKVMAMHLSVLAKMQTADDPDLAYWATFRKNSIEALLKKLRKR